MRPELDRVLLDECTSFREQFAVALAYMTGMVIPPRSIAMVKQGLRIWVVYGKRSTIYIVKEPHAAKLFSLWTGAWWMPSNPHLLKRAKELGTKWRKS